LEIGKGQDKEVVNRLHKSFPTAEIATVMDLAGFARLIKLTYNK
jgi:ABC-type arginine/histidine transport system permease subunit